MTAGEFRDLLVYVRGALNSLGLGEIAEDELYRASPESEELLPPDMHLIAMLKRTLEVLDLFDNATVEAALARIRDVSQGAPQGAELILPGEGGERRIDLLNDLPALSETKAQLRRLIGQLFESRPDR